MAGSGLLSFAKSNQADCSFTEAYDQFAVNYGNVLLGYVFFSNSVPMGILPPSLDAGIKIATLVGTMIGQVSFGLLNDTLGRKKVSDEQANTESLVNCGY